VFYDQPEQKTGTASEGAAGGNAAPEPGASAIKRLQASGNVTITSADQTAVGDNGDFDIKASTATLTGHVVLTQGKNVVKGKRLNVNMNTNVVQLNGGVRAHFVQEEASRPAPTKAKPRRLRGKSAPSS
jgi:lipopolysaccharide export system protein LptA